MIDFYDLIWLIPIFALGYFLVGFYRDSIKNFKVSVPEFTPVNLPEKIYIDHTVKREHGFVKGVKNIITLGGHDELNKAVSDYKKAYQLYADQFNQSIYLRKQISDGLNEMGELTYLILGELQKSSKLLNKNIDGLKQAELITTSDLNKQLRNLDKVYNNHKFNSNNALILGSAAAGGLLAVGSWTLVSMLGTASTGTAIATLSGVAAHNAILAWFGGGALAAGGGGMAAGTLTLGFIVMAPMIVYSTWKTYKKAEEVNNETMKLPAETQKIKIENESLEETRLMIQEKVRQLKQQLANIQKVNNQVYDILYPRGLASELHRNINQFFNKDFYTNEEAMQLDKLNEYIEEVYQLFERMQQTSTRLGLPLK